MAHEVPAVSACLGLAFERGGPRPRLRRDVARERNEHETSSSRSAHPRMLTAPPTTTSDPRIITRTLGVRRFPPHPIPLASDRPLLARSEAKSCGTTEVETRINVDDGLRPGRHFETCGSADPQVSSSHLSSHLFARQSSTRKRSATETLGSEPFRDCQRRSETDLKRLLIRRFWVRNPGGARRSTRSVALSEIDRESIE